MPVVNYPPLSEMFRWRWQGETRGAHPQPLPDGKGQYPGALSSELFLAWQKVELYNFGKVVK